RPPARRPRRFPGHGLLPASLAAAGLLRRDHLIVRGPEHVAGPDAIRDRRGAAAPPGRLHGAASVGSLQSLGMAWPGGPPKVARRERARAPDRARLHDRRPAGPPLPVRSGRDLPPLLRPILLATARLRRRLPAATRYRAPHSTAPGGRPRLSRSARRLAPPVRQLGSILRAGAGGRMTWTLVYQESDGECRPDEL